ncbi:TetR/AcrR family transcriptional regulator C-terminal domain-containing protein [Clostridium cellulovorans]|uniref:Regulatory protein TetR n=1 Tax=Clostridium cellulovorans (strain ATCC 35296 / DSM 3052 / OCM 3 / 743B) TaxID=573061 RepID=D9SUR9_CLOC7|nr:TetR/AcrR family transcriptional regulator C-terminal domain-containing protein [Clostridium cellulovorans]ADL50974.1 regulatory protein TetR [Clostridium cellulovorans 743B]
MSNSSHTKQLMAESLKKQMEKTPINKISIQNIVDGCGLTRQSFYYHFQDVYELLGWIYSNQAAKWLEEESRYENWKEGYLEVFKYIEKNKTFCLNTLHSVGREHLERFLFASASKHLIGIVEEISGDMKVPEEKKKIVVDFYTPAFIALVGKWMEGGMKTKPEEIIEAIGVLVDGTIEKALKEYSINK